MISTMSNRDAIPGATIITLQRWQGQQQRQRRDVLVFVFFSFLLWLVILPCCQVVDSTNVDALPPNLYAEDMPNDNDVAAFVSNDHHGHHHQQQQHHVHKNSQQANPTEETTTAFVSDHTVVTNLQQPNLQATQQQQQGTVQQQLQRRWGAATGKNTPTAPIPPARTTTTTTPTSTTSTAAFQSETTTAGSDSNNESIGLDGIGTGTGLPFVPPKVTTPTATASPVLHAPPEGFVVTARVYTDPADKLSHFDTIPTNIVLPFYECGATGLSTNALPLSHASFRYALAGSQAWSGDFSLQQDDEDDQPKPKRRRKRKKASTSSPSANHRLIVEGDEGQDWHPQLVVALTDVEIVLNSGENRVFQRGDIILLEDTVLGGHKLRAITATTMTHGANQLPKDMSVLILTLPHTYHQIGKTHHSLQGFTTTLTTPPCPVDSDDMTQDLSKSSSSSSTEPSAQGKSSKSSPLTRLSASFAIPNTSLLPHRPKKKQIQQAVLAIIGLSVSTVLADFLGKVAPLWLAVGIGGTCFVVGGTYGIVSTGMQALEYIDMTWERHRLLSSIRETPPSSDAATTTASTTLADSNTVQSTTGTGVNSGASGMRDSIPSDRPDLRPTPLDPPFYER